MGPRESNREADGYEQSWGFMPSVFRSPATAQGTGSQAEPGTLEELKRQMWGSWEDGAIKGHRV